MASEGAIIPQLVESITQSSSPSTATCSVPMAGGDISSSAQTTIPCQTEVLLDEKTKRELFTDTFCRVCGAVLQFESHRNAHYEGKRHAQKVRLYFLNKELEEMAYKKKADQKAERVNFHVDQQLAQDKNKFCSLCNMVFSSPVVAKSHYVGKIHAKKLKQFSGETSEWTAEVSDSSVSAEAAVPSVGEQDAVVSPLSEKSNQQEASSEPSSADNEMDLSDPNKYCKLCCASFNNPLVAQQHYNGKKHARNELRRKMMEEMEDTGLTVDAGGDGAYVCPICSIAHTSIEMYQSHMQGNKHQIKESIVANLMKTTKKTYDSFENELEDYVKVQKARGLEPKMQFRPEKDQQDTDEEIEHSPTPPNPNPAAFKYFGHQAMPYPAYNPLPLQTSEPRMAGWDQAYWAQKPTRMSMKTAPPRKPPPSSPNSSDYSSSDDSSSSYKKEKRHRREQRSKERKHRSKSKRENGSSERKKRKIEESDSGKEDSEKEKKSDGVSGDKSKHKKEKKKKEELSTDKESKKHKKPKKVEDQRTEEEMLWDESILGF